MVLQSTSGEDDGDEEDEEIEEEEEEKQEKWMKKHKHGPSVSPANGNMSNSSRWRSDKATKENNAQQSHRNAFSIFDKHRRAWFELSMMIFTMVTIPCALALT